MTVRRPTRLSLLFTNHHGACGRSVRRNKFERREGVILPQGRRALVEKAQLPLLERVAAACIESLRLLVTADGEPDLEKMDAIVHEELLERNDLIEETHDLLVSRETHDAFDAGSVVPGSIEERNLTARRELFDVPLEIPLSLLDLVRSW